MQNIHFFIFKTVKHKFWTRLCFIWLLFLLKCINRNRFYKILIWKHLLPTWCFSWYINKMLRLSNKKSCRKVWTRNSIPGIHSRAEMPISYLVRMGRTSRVNLWLRYQIKLRFNCRRYRSRGQRATWRQGCAYASCDSVPKNC